MQGMEYYNHICKAIIFLLLLFSQNSNANTNHNPSIGSIDLLMDTSNTLTLKEVRNSPYFKSVENGYVVYKAYNNWFRIKIINSTPSKKNCFLSLYGGDYFDLTYYHFLRDSLIVQYAGFFHKKTRSTINSNPVFNISLPDTDQFYIFIKTNGAGSNEMYSFKIQNSTEFFTSQQQIQFTFGIFYGILIIIFYYFSLKRKAFLFYAIYVSLAFYLFSYVDGIPLLGLLNGIGESHRLCFLAAINLQFGFVPFMAIHYVQLDQVNKKLMKISKLFLTFSFFTLVVAFFFPSAIMYEFQFLFCNAIIAVCVVLCIIIGIKGIKINKILGWSYLIAHIILSLSVIISITDSFGISDTNTNLYYDLIKLGFLCEITILSLALALYFRHIDLNLLKKNMELNVLSIDFDETKKKFSSLEGNFLRSQMNPHFIFNSLNSIQSYILSNNTALATRYLTSFSRLMRSILENSRESEVLLANEINAIKHYLELEKMRFKNLFDYSIIIDKDINIDVMRIPPMLIQPYIENAIIHGLISKGGDGHIEIDLKPANGLIRCTITDNGVGRKAAQNLNFNKEAHHRSSATGITAERLKQLNVYLKEKVSVNIIDMEDAEGNSTGTKVVIYIPYLSNK
jgi:sensor histidine kinase YesM